MLAGTILVVINHGASIVAGAISATLVVQVLLTYLVPLVVSTAATVSAIQDRRD